MEAGTVARQLPWAPSLDEHEVLFVIVNLTGWGLAIYGGCKFFTGGKKDKNDEKVGEPALMWRTSTPVRYRTNGRKNGYHSLKFPVFVLHLSFQGRFKVACDSGTA
ncbi:unnamed protein product [Linum tenue]|uniref:Uncharacterized protein n=1 Tax=Linum tenue TaxID=586396 RepID=A0AAV0GSZ8_9ROSI|nr:unnamed protein product [Linum tenue]